ncbi:MAG: helix-turn-helix domain-containing protein [Egibacteraceae bacterium]
MEHHVSVGERIRYWRERRGHSRPVLAGLVGRSASWLEKVERGDRPADNVHVLLHLARVLKVELGDLLGPGAELPPDGSGPQDLPKGLPALRRCLYWPDALVEPDRDPERIDMGNLAARIEQAYTASMNGQWTRLALLLPDAIADARALARHLTGDGQRRAWALLSHAYRLASELCRELRECDLAWIAAERAVAAAERADDRLHMALATRGLSVVLLGAGHLDVCRAVSARGAALVEDGLECAPPEQVSAWGAIMLASSIAAARAYDHAGNRELLSRARWAAGLLPDGWIDPVTAFCPTNVAFHEINAAYDSGDPVEALRLADLVDFDGLPFPHRQARTWLDVARSHGLRRNDGAAVGVLLEAERVAPERMRYDRGAHDLVAVLLRRERKSATPGLRGLAQRIGVN